MEDIRDIYADIAELRAELAHCIMTHKERRETQLRLDQALSEAKRRQRRMEGAAPFFMAWLRVPLHRKPTAVSRVTTQLPGDLSSKDAAVAAQNDLQGASFDRSPECRGLTAEKRGLSVRAARNSAF